MQFRRLGIKSIALFLLGVTLSMTVAACSGGNAGSNVALTLVGYAVPKAAHDAIIPRFIEQWKKEKGQDVIFSYSYGASGSQTRAVIDGLDADITHLAVAADTERIVKEGLIRQDWAARVPNQGIVARTVVAIVVRPGNPKNIQSFQDLTRDDVKWVTPDPKTSGGARWNFMALWNDALKRSNNDEAKAKILVAKEFKNVAVLARDAREATDAFAKQGQGDALINYENEVILAQQKGISLEYIVPAVNISIDTPLAVVDKNVDRNKTRDAAEAYAKFLFTPAAQAEFVKLGFRPFSKDAGQFQPVKDLATIQDFGGWGKVQKKFFEDGGIFDQTIAASKQS
ncbi:sulfate ABC transporter substrate-binding protein [Leptolyngbya boryana CZ1]|uniref:Sulfate ABC transporter substrate-binding protein n=1 Tax=Leptolyngbya boryana CZ1 TaxID=3060204 RepID=A0AA96WT16_LEPBY|nr:sulfate ABC transporter substrate-binding protein [Leptolyngbya boryana]WNZ45047.1 sulfate ABC transporter substrate-binding protein [Leptolyngbya boryana CZ1]